MCGKINKRHLTYVAIVCIVGSLAGNTSAAVSADIATDMQNGVTAGTLARQSDFVFEEGIYITPRAGTTEAVADGVTNFNCILPPDDGTFGSNITVNIGAIRPGNDTVYSVFPLPLYKQTVTVRFASASNAIAAYIRPVPVYHGHLYALSGRFDDTDYGTVLSCEGLGAGGVNSTAFVNGLYFQGMASKQPPSIEQWRRVLLSGSTIGNHSWHHGASPSTDEYDDAGNPVPPGIFDFSYGGATPKRHFLDILHPRAFYEAALDTLIMSAAGPGNGYGTTAQYWNWINSGHYAFSQLKVEYPSSNVVWEQYDQGLILDQEKLILRARAPTHAQAKVNPATYKTMAEEIVANGSNDCWQTTWNDYGAYRYQYYHSPVLKKSVTNDMATFEIYRPELIDLNNDTPLTWEIVGAESNSVVSITVGNGSCQPVALVAGPDRGRYAFDLLHDQSQKKLPTRIGFIGQYGDGVYRPDNFIQREDPDFPGITASLIITNGTTQLTVTNGSSYNLSDVIVTYRFPSGYVPETARVRLSGTITAGSVSAIAPLTVTVSSAETNGEWIAGVQMDFVQNNTECRLHVIGQSSDAALANNPPLPEPPAYETLAYCDLSHYAGQPDESNHVNTIRSGSLIDFQTGGASGISVGMTGGAVGNEPWFETFGGISDAYRTFGTNMDNVGYINGVTTFTFTGLNPVKKYEVDFTSAAEITTTGLTKIVISGADSFTNQSSPHARMTGNAVQISGAVGETSEALLADNAESGLVIRYANIVPSSDGTVTFTASGNVYLSGYKIGVRSDGEPQNIWPLAWIDLPVTNLVLNPGDNISFHGHASDTEDGPLTGTNLVWQIIRTGAGVVATQTGTNGTYSVPTDITEETAFEIKLLATDSAGATGTDTITFSVMPSAPASVMIGYDDFDGTASFVSRINSSAVNAGAATWDIVSRTTLNTNSNDILDTSKYKQNGTAGDGVDVVGFLESTKTDNFFGIYRGGLTVGTRTLTYTFNIAGYTNLSVAMDWVASGSLGTTVLYMSSSIDSSAANTNFFAIRANTADPVYTMEDERSVTNASSGRVWINGADTGVGLTDNFTTFTPAVSGTGSILTLTLTMSSTTAGSAFGMDNLKVQGEVVRVSGDADADGLPDSWETQYFGGSTNANPQALAANGINTVRQTYLAGLNPTNAQSRFVVSDFKALASEKILHWQGISGRVYSVYGCTNLLDGFQPVATNIGWQQASWTGLVNQTGRQAFYKIVVEIQP